MNTADIARVAMLKKEIEILRLIADREGSGMGHYYTTINLLENHIKWIEEEDD